MSRLEVDLELAKCDIGVIPHSMIMHVEEPPSSEK